MRSRLAAAHCCDQNDKLGGKKSKSQSKTHINKRNVSVAIKSELNPEDREPTDGVDSPEDET